MEMHSTLAWAHPSSRDRSRWATLFPLLADRQTPRGLGASGPGQDVLHRAPERDRKAALRAALPGAGPGQPARTVDVYGLQILDATLEAGNSTEVEADTTALALLLKHEFLDGGADDVTLANLGEVLLDSTLTALSNFLVRSNSQSSVAPASFTVGDGGAISLHTLFLHDLDLGGWPFHPAWSLLQGKMSPRHQHNAWIKELSLACVVPFG